MSQNKYLRKKSRKKRYTNLLSACIIIVILLIGSIGILQWVDYNDTKSLIDTWQSEETNQILSFTTDGRVISKSNPSINTYRIISPTLLEYTIDDKTFQMYYHIEDDILYWGLNELNLEKFNRR